MFDVAKILGGRQNVPETLELPVTGGATYHVGEALVVTSGKLALAKGAVAVQYISLEEYVAPASGERKLKCFRVMPDQLFAVPVSVAPTGLLTGGKVQIGADGLTVTATAADTGGAEIVDLCNASKAGDKILVVLK